MVEAGVEQFDGFGFIAGSHDDEVGNAAQIDEVKAARVGGAIFAHQTGAVNGEEYIQGFAGRHHG